MSASKIEWTQQTWNPVIGCTKVSPGCKHCYAETMHTRLQAMGSRDYYYPFTTVRPLHDRLETPIKRLKPTVYFVNSMSDLFHESVTFDFINEVMGTIRQTPQHTYQILTKRAERMREYFIARPVPDNAWIGVSVENREYGLPRITALQAINARTRFLSCEPLLEDLGQFDMTGIHWVIAGGESGTNARRMQPYLIRNLRDKCQQQSVPFFFKQWGQWSEGGKKQAKSLNGRMLDGRTWDEMPVNG